MKKEKKKQSAIGKRGRKPNLGKWTPTIIGRLGKQSDLSIAQEFGLAESSVRRKRTELGVEKAQVEPQGITELRRYEREHGSPHVLRQFICNNGFALGKWVRGVRDRYSDGDLSPRMQHLMESIPGWSWHLPSQKWEYAYQHLQEFLEQKGHSRVSRLYVCPDGFPLGNWVAIQRKLRNTKKSSLTSKCQKMLESLPGWSWSCYGDDWENGYLRLVEYSQKHSTTRIPRDYCDADGFALGKWVATQRLIASSSRQKYPDRILKLEAITTWNWKVNENCWESMFQLLQEYITQNGHACVPRKFQTPEGTKLGSWVAKQRVKFKIDELSPDREKKLSELPEWKWSLVDRKNDFLNAFSRYIDFHGHSHVPNDFCTEDGIKLGSWLAIRRRDLRRGTLSPKLRSALRLILKTERYRVPKSFPRL